MAISTINGASAGSSGTLLASGGQPAFSAYRSTSQSVSANTWVKVQFNAEDFDTANAFDSTTNYRFQPNVAGYYQINANIYFSASNTGSYYYTQIYKNGSTCGVYSILYAPSTSEVSVALSQLFYLNGSTDFLEVYGFTPATSGQVFYGSNGPTRFSGYLARGV